MSQPLIAPESVQRATLANGLTVLVRRDTSAPVVAIVTYVKAGYFDEPDEVAGIAHVLEHMFFKGTAQRGVGIIAQETKAAGGYLNAGTIYDHTSYYTVLPSSSFVQGLEIQGDAYANSIIDAEELGRELEVIIQEAKRKADNPSAVATETLYEVLHERHRIRRWRIGHEETLRRLTRPDLTGFYRNFYRPANTILSIAGDIDPQHALHEAERIYGAIPDGQIVREPGPEEPEHAGFRFRELAGDITQTQLAVGWRTPGTLHHDTPLLDVAAAVLGAGRASRLYRAVRDRKLAASISAYDYTPTELGVFTVHAEGPSETSAQAAQAAWAQLRELREAGVRDEEILRSRRLFESRWVRRLETMVGQANYLAEWEALGDWRLGAQYLDRLLSATADQVTEVVRRYLTSERAAAVVYRPASAASMADGPDDMRRLLDGAPTAAAPSLPARPAARPAAAGAPKFEREEAGVRVYRTGSGVPILVRRKQGAPLVHFGVFVRGGASDEPADLAGLTSLLMRTSIKGTSRRTATQIAEDAELLGGTIGASAGAESFGWSLSVPVAYTLDALDLLADVVQHATIPDEALDTECAVALADLELLRDDMYGYPLRLLMQTAFAGHPYGVPTSGSRESLPRIDAERLRAWHRSQVLEAPASIGVVGDVDPDQAAAAVAGYFGELRAAEPTALPVPRWPEAPVVTAEQREKAQTALALAFPAPPCGDPSRFAAQLTAGVASGLGGRFFEELRDRQSLAYTVSAFTSQRRLAGTFVSYIATSPDKEEVARSGLLREMARLRAEPVSPEELSRAKAYAIGTHAIAQQSGASVLGEILDAWMFGRSGLAELEEHDVRIRAVTAAEMQSFAEQYLDERCVVEAVVRGKEL
ncbi:MAG TPA: pitrilysin family protein [Gemmatimonadaceae bacterium]|nr:pitrilysin family protein [Gemmatimonadaceae bacterium]